MDTGQLPPLGVNWCGRYRHHPTPCDGPALMRPAVDDDTPPGEFSPHLLPRSSAGAAASGTAPQRSVESGYVLDDKGDAWLTQPSTEWQLELYSMARTLYVVVALGNMPPQASHVFDIGAVGTDDFNRFGYYQAGTLATIAHLLANPELCWAANVPDDAKQQEGEDDGLLVPVAPQEFDLALRENAKRCSGARADPTFTWKAADGRRHEHARSEVRLIQLSRVKSPMRDSALAYVYQIRLFDWRLCLGRGLKRLLKQNRKKQPKEVPPVLSSGAVVNPKTKTLMMDGESSPLDVWQVEPQYTVTRVEHLDTWFADASGNAKAYRELRAACEGLVDPMELFGHQGPADLFEIFSRRQFDPTSPYAYDFVSRSPEIQGNRSVEIANILFLESQPNLQALLRRKRVRPLPEQVEAPMEEEGEE